MNFTRQLRKKATNGFLKWGQDYALKSDHSAIERLRTILLRVTKAAIPLRKRLERNMKLAGIYQSHLIDAHFERVIDQMIMLAHIFRAGFPKSGCPERFTFDDSFKLLEQAYSKGKGVINIAPHICGYPVYAPIVTPRIPCATYLRRNKDPHKMDLNQAIGNAGNGELIYPPEGATKAQRLQVAIDVLRQGKMMFICADTPRKSDDGVPVTIYGRTAYFPIGVFIMSLRTGAPVVPVIWHWENGQYHIHYDNPIELSRGGDLRKKAAAAVQKWAQSVDTFLHKHPDMWWNWLDKRWTHIIRNGKKLEQNNV
ncbi:MAG: lysophospholipid acyltransferase family protein [Planctomycetota bacterium]|jgi:lauroyl/myristoyl acyltransferase